MLQTSLFIIRLIISNVQQLKANLRDPKAEKFCWLRRAPCCTGYSLLFHPSLQCCFVSTCGLPQSAVRNMVSELRPDAFLPWCTGLHSSPVYLAAPVTEAHKKASKSVSSLAVDTCSVVMVLIIFSNFYLDPSDAQSWYLLGRACMAGQNATKPTKRINRPCTEMGATQHFSGRSTFSISKSTSSVTPLTLIRVRSE
jgi:hypothetical protein